MSDEDEFVGFTPLEINLTGGDNAWPELQGTDYGRGKMTHALLLVGGTDRGNHSIAVRGKLDDGREVVLETTWALFYAAAHGFEARFGIPQ